MKKLKGIWMALLTVILSVAMLLGTTTIGAFAAAFDGSNITTDGSAGEATFITKMKYGVATTAFAGASKVVTPSGDEITTGLNSFTPLEIGAYTVYYDNYSYVVSCYLDKEYELRVDHNGADIATYIATGTALKIPAASVWYPSEKDGVDYEKAADQEVYSIVEGLSTENAAGTSAATERTVMLPEASSTYTVHYFCKVKGEKVNDTTPGVVGTKYLSKNFTVIAQKGFTDSTKPTLNVVNIPTNISLNTKVTLPKATATDNSDSNVKVEIFVDEYVDGLGYQPVKVAKVGKDGYAEVPVDDDGKYKYDPDAENVRFENDFNLSFYPTNATTYRVTYKAVDDNNNYAVNSHVYTTTASDRTAPVLDKIDDSMIPTSWGLANVTPGENAEDTLDAGVIRFPRPYYKENSGKTPTVIFELRDTVNNNVVVRFDNINDMNGDTAGKNATYTYDPAKASYGLLQPENGASVSWGKDYLEIDLTDYTDHLDEKKTATGTYTVRYEAKDAVPNTTTKTYDITIEKEFSDAEAPNITDIEFEDSYVVFTGAEDEEFTIPSVEVRDNIDTRPIIDYRLYAGQDKGDNYITVKGGEVAKLSLEGVSKTPTMTVEDKDGKIQTLTFGSDMTLVYDITAIDDAGNKSNKTNRGATKPEEIVNIVNGSSLGVPGDVTHTIATATVDGVVNADPAKELNAGDKVNIGSFNMAVAENLRDFYGFEISTYLTDTDDKRETATVPWLTGKVTLKTYFDNGNLYVDNVMFTVPDAEKVTVVLRAFNIMGASKTYSQAYNIKEDNSNNDNQVSSIIMDNEGSVYTSYLLKNRYIDKPADMANDYVIREIQGAGKFSLMGFKFTAYNTGTFKFNEYYENKAGEEVPFDLGGATTFKVTDASTPAWQIQGKMPTHVELDDTVELPKVVASNEYANAKITLAGTFTAAGSSTPTKLNVATGKTEADNRGKDITLNEDGVYSFTANKNDGTYNLTYTATYGDGATISQTYTIKAGDIAPPDFTVGDHARTAVENGTFTFKEIDLSEDEISGDMKYRKSLIGPDGSTVYTVEGTGENYRTMTKPTGSDAYKFTKTGTYTVEYVVTDKANNATRVTQTITVSAAKVNNPVSTKIISTILIIVGVLLIAGVILYFIRFRKVKSK